MSRRGRADRRPPTAPPTQPGRWRACAARQVTHVNQYEMRQVLGQGAYGVVYKASGLVLGQGEQAEVAVKVLNRSVLKRKKVRASAPPPLAAAAPF